MSDIDLGIIEQYADHLYRKAAARVTAYTIVGALIGALAGAVAGGLIHVTSQPLIPSHLGYATLLVGAAAIGFGSNRLGVQRAFLLRLQAQMALHQLQVERTIMRPAAAVAAVAAAAVPRLEAPAPPAPPLAQPVAPVVAPPVAPQPVAPQPVAPPAFAPPVFAPPPFAPPPFAPPPVAPPAFAPPPVVAMPSPPLTVPAPLSVAPSAPEPVPPAAAAPVSSQSPRLVEPPSMGAPPLTPPLSARRYS